MPDGIQTDEHGNRVGPVSDGDAPVIKGDLENRITRGIYEAYSREAAASAETTRPGVRKWLVRDDDGVYGSCHSARAPVRNKSGIWSGPEIGASGWFRPSDPAPDGSVCGVTLKPGGGPVDVTEWLAKIEPVQVLDSNAGLLPAIGIVEDEIVAATAAGGSTVRSWCGFEEHTLIWYEEEKASGVVCDPKYLGLPEGEVFLDDHVAFRLTDEPTLRFRSDLASEIVRVSCETCKERECARKQRLPSYPSIEDYPKCWVFNAEPAPRFEPRTITYQKQ